jgi:dephospho-CoA kinase
MLIVALTGGIGSGKTTVGSIFAGLGAVVVDSDQIAREVVERGSEGFNLIIAEFGDGILKDGDINRSALGELVFADLDKLGKLEAITHPLIRQAFAKIVDESPKDSIIINQIPLLVESKHEYNFDYVITISVSDAIRRERLLARGLSQGQIQARLNAQASDFQRESIADHVIKNSGDLAALTQEVERVWHLLVSANKAK